MSHTGKRRSTLAPTPFARHLGEYLWHLVSAEGADRSGRWLSARTDRSYGYWEKILNLRQAMTTNDIALVAELFGISPYDFVRDAREWNGGAEAARGALAAVTPIGAPNVGGTLDTDPTRDREPRVAYESEGGTGELADE